jgi:hypothetical protein
VEFEFSAEERAFAAELEAFLDAHAGPEVADANPEQLSQTVDTPAKRAFMRKLAERGWLGMSWPKAYGGQEKSGIYDFLLTEALSRRGCPQPGKGVGIVGKTLIRHGSEKLKREFLPQIIRGEIEFAIGYSEPQAGSDAANMQLRATRVDGGWQLDGRKIWTTSAHFADWYWVGARTDTSHKHKGITLFLVPMRHPGLTIHPTWTIGDERTNEVFFDDVFVHDDYVVGDLNHGFQYISEALDLERFTMFTLSPIADRTRVLVNWARAAKRDDQPVREDRDVRRVIANIVTDTAGAKALRPRCVCAAKEGSGKPPTIESSQYKLFTTTLSQRVCDEALDLMSVAGTIREGQDEAPLRGRFEGAYRATMNETVGGGGSEIQKNIIARRHLGLPKNF